MNDTVLDVLLRSAKVSLVASMLVMPPCILLGYFLSRRKLRGHTLLLSIASLPLVVPPTAVGYLLLRLLAFDGPLGPSVLGVDLDILLTWKAAVLACVVMSIPLVLRTTLVAFDGVDPRLEAMARTLGFGPTETFLRFTLPMAKRGLFSAWILGFTRALGEFGATVIIAGNIPGSTQTLASAIYAAEQENARQRADMLIAVAFALGLSAVLIAEWLARARVSEPRS